MALQALQEGKVDFTDKKVQIGRAKMDLGLGNGRDLLEVDLGDVSSLQSNEVHIQEMLEKSQLAKGDVVVDDATNKDDAVKYKLVMVGRKVTAEE